MAQFPNVLTGKVTGTTLSQMIEQTFRKPSSLPRASAATTTADDFFTGISLTVGTWLIDCTFFTFMTTTAANAAVAGFRINWGFTGSWSGNRACRGIANVTTNTSTADCTMRNIGSALGTDQTYGCIATFYQPVTEKAVVTVTTAGTMSINWGQVTSNANATNLGANSLIEIRQIE